MMTENTATDKSYLQYESVDVYFTYSFVVDFGEASYEEFVAKNPSVWKAGPDALPDRHGVTPFLAVQKWSDNVNGKYTPLAVSRPIEFTGATDHEGRYTLKYFDPDQYQKEPTAELNVACDAVARLFYNGSGCVTFRIRSKLPVGSAGGWRAIKHILALSRSTYTPVGVATLADTLLYRIFRNALEPLAKDGGFELLCDKISNAADADESTKSDTFGVCPQNPSTFVVVELRGGTDGGRTFLETDSGLQKAHQELASIVLNIVLTDCQVTPTSHIDHVIIPERLRTNSGGLRNCAWDSRLFIACDRLTVLLAKYKGAGPQHGFIERSLLDALEVLRTRWHMSIVMNALLDQDIDREKSSESKRNLDALRDLIRRRQQFGKFLHDPLSYRFVGGSVTDVVERLEAELSLDKLQRATCRKFEALDKVLQDRLTYVQLQEFEKYCANRMD